MKKTILILNLICNSGIARPIDFSILTNSDTDSRAYGISSNGEKIVGYSNYNNGSQYIQIPCYWNANGDLHYIVDPSSAHSGGSAYSSNSDGSVIVGNLANSGQLVAFRWKSSGSVFVLPEVVLYRDARAASVSESGVIVGTDGNDSLYGVEVPPNSSCFSWTEQGGIKNISKYIVVFGNYGFPASKALSVSSDGSIIAGCYLSGPFGTEKSTIAGYYQNNEWKRLDPNLKEGSVAYFVSSDGNYFAGSYNGKAFRKRMGYPYESLFSGTISSMTPDGKIAVGCNSEGNAVIWTKTRGSVQINDIVYSLPNLPDWFQKAEMATGISVDGTKIVGYTSRTFQVNNVPNTIKQAFILSGLNVFSDSCPSDLNKDGLVNDMDFSAFASQYDSVLCSIDCNGDINLDSFVDDKDFSLFVVAYDNLNCE
jgi:hypothetical protein